MHNSLRLRILTIAFGLLAGAATAQARVDTWVSPDGSDAGTCPMTAPCRTFAYAHGQTNNHGSINVLSSGSFGALTVTKPISIVAQGVEAMIVTGAEAGIIVQAGPTAVVSLRGLTIDMRGADNHGISFVSGSALYVQNCVIHRASNGIEFAPASGITRLHVSDSVISNSGDTGINIQPTGSADVRIMIDRVRMENAQFHGIAVAGDNTTGSLTAMIRESVASGGLGTGMSASDAGGGTTKVMIDRSAILNNFHGVAVAGANATIWIGDSTISGNVGIGFVSSGGVSASYGTNLVNGNGTDGAATSSAAHK
jgi:hypothetical protein